MSATDRHTDKETYREESLLFLKSCLINKSLFRGSNAAGWGTANFTVTVVKR